MNKITFPIKFDRYTDEVANLQNGFLLLLSNPRLFRLNEGPRNELEKALRKERDNRKIGDATRELLRRFQQPPNMQPTGSMDRPTADALNRALEALGAFRPDEPAQPREVKGRIRRENESPATGCTVRAEHVLDGVAPLKLGEVATDEQGQYTIRYAPPPRVAAINLRVTVSDERGNVLRASKIIREARPSEVVDLILSVEFPSASQRSLKGRVFFEDQSSAGKLALRLYRLDFGGETTRLSDTVTNDDGSYELAFTPGAKAGGLEIRASSGAEKEVSLTKPMYDLGDASPVVLNLVAPISLRSLEPEYDRMMAALAKQLGDVTKLAEANEKEGQQDLTLLASATGWDARLIVLAVYAQRLAPVTKLEPAPLYALMRVGLPTDAAHLAAVVPDAIAPALKKAVEARIVALSEAQMAAAQAAFEKFAGDTRLGGVIPGMLSSTADMIKKSGLTPDDQSRFTKLYLAHTGTAAELWKKVNAELPGKADSLRVQGKLAFLTMNNAAVVESLQQEIESPARLSKLVDLNFHLPETWETRLKDLSGSDDALGKLIPPAFEGETVSDRLRVYSADLARKVRLSFPTRIAIQNIGNANIELGEALTPVRAELHSALKKAEDLGFRLGETPVGAFLRDHDADLLDGIDDGEVKTNVVKGMRTLHRLHQITPSDEALNTMFRLGFDSAQSVLKFPRGEFIACFKDEFPPEEAAQIHDKAREVHHTVKNFFAMAKQMDSAPPVHAISAPPEIRKQVKEDLIKCFPTLESLFGSLDFCECEHCRSVLSPAAYFVDLLQFLDRDDLAWKTFVDGWPKEHNGARYEDKYEKPYEILKNRRPDLPHLPLTCENTHTALPYIDVVNEIFEFYLAPAPGHPEFTGVRDTGEATSAELLAEPRYLIPQAYEKLRNAARYPLTLPFDLWHATAREFFAHFEIPRWRVMEVFRPVKQPAPVAGQPQKEMWRGETFTEQLELSPAEYALFTQADPLVEWFKLFGYEDAPSAAELKSAKTLSRRLGVTYKQLVELVQTGFVNPRLDRLVFLRKLGVSATDMLRYKEFAGHEKLSAEERAAFDDQLKSFAVAMGVGEADLRARIDREWQDATVEQSLLLRDTDAAGNFDTTIFQYADGQPADDLTFVRLNLFVRLWKKLRWSIEETDRALTTFIPAERRGLTKFTPNAAQNFTPALQTALCGIAHLKTLDARVKAGKASRLKLLALWNDLATTGGRPLYAQLFLQAASLKTDAIFDDPLGKYLQYFDAGANAYKPFTWQNGQVEDRVAGRVPLATHLTALQGALNLTADEIGWILADAMSTDNPPVTHTPATAQAQAELSLTRVSTLYSYGLLARAMKLSVRDLIALKQLSGLNPFARLASAELGFTAENLVDVAPDSPFSQTLRLLDVAERVKESDFKISELDYLLRHRFDPVGTFKPDDVALLAVVKSLKQEIGIALAGLPTDQDLREETFALTDEVLREKLALVFPPEVVETFFGFWKNTAGFTATDEAVAPAEKLDAARYEVGDPPLRVAYVAAGQRLSGRGVMTAKRRGDILGWINQPSVVFTNLLDALQQQSEKALKSFFKTNFEGAFLENDLPGAAWDDTSGLSGDNNRTPNQKKLLSNILPALRARLTRQAVVKTVAAALGAEPLLTDLLLAGSNSNGNAPLVADPSDRMVALLEAFAGAVATGVTRKCFASSDGNGNDPKIETVSDVSTQGVPANTNSVSFEGHFEVRIPGEYRFTATAGNQNAEVEFGLKAFPDAVLKGVIATAHGTKDVRVELAAGVPYHFTFAARKLQGGKAELTVLAENLPDGSLGRLTLFPGASVERVRRAKVVLEKALQLVGGFAFNETEIRHLLSNNSRFDDLDFSKLPTAAEEDTSDKAQQNFKRFLRLAAVARLKRDFAPGAEIVTRIFAATKTDEAFKVLAEFTRREVDVIRKTSVTLFGDASVLTDEKQPAQLWEALQMMEKIGVPAAKLADWSVAAPDDALARDLRNTVKARYELETWQRVAKPIFDRLRQMKRDALVAFILQKLGLDRPEQLFEHFLLDPGMEPVVQASRLRLALSSVQTFIQRVFLNLEKKIHPSALNAQHWQWMKRYRVWEANRKIFLYPENWLEPEFRDDKTHLFKELEGSLLQGDVSNDLAEDAFFNYLKKLEGMARLDLVTMCAEELSTDSQQTDHALHVIGRAMNEPGKYFYRCYAHGMWTPWEPVSVEIEGDHVTAIVWRNRLHLFWVTFLEKVTPNAPPPADLGEKKVVEFQQNDVLAAGNAAAKKEIQAQLNWSDYFQGEWTQRQSGGFGNPLSVRLEKNLTEFNARDVFIHASIEHGGKDEQDVVVISLDNFPGSKSGAFRVVSKHSPPETTGAVNLEALPYRHNDDNTFNSCGTRYEGRGPLTAMLATTLRTTDGNFIEGEDSSRHSQAILTSGDKYSIMTCTELFAKGVVKNESDLPDPDNPGLLVIPFFYQDIRHSFFVEPTFSEDRVSDWEPYVVDVPVNNLHWDIVKHISLEAAIPRVKSIPPDPIGPLTRFKFAPATDLFAQPDTAVRFGSELIGNVGGRAAIAGNGMPGTLPNSSGNVRIIGGGGLASLRNIGRATTNL